ncbi:MAG: 7-cyano-7-deazaguanine synthase [Planctomycetota bacterium]|jgi:7-cyano-7-deazaguanine synthase
MATDERPAVVLLSGGLDSATACAIARDGGFRLFAMTFDYGQRHRDELDAARRVAEVMAVVEHRLVTIDLRAFGGSALTADIDVPKDRGVGGTVGETMGETVGETAGETVGGAVGDSTGEANTEIPITYVPARNTIFLSYALAWAEVVGAADIFLGVNAVDYSGYPDCRPEYIQAFEAMAQLATRAAVEGGRPVNIHAPLIDMEKAAIIRLGLSLGVDYSLTHSCYDPRADGSPCGRCDSCRLRAAAFAELQIVDPLLS